MKTFGQAICAANGESFCTNIKKDGEGICKAGQGSFCSQMETFASGICAALGESFCNRETDESKWLKKLSEKCGG